MSKFITKEMRNSNMSKYINVNDLLGNPVQLNLITYKEVERESKATGNRFVMNEYGFIDINGEEKIISDFQGGSLWQAISEIDPEEHALLKIWSEEIEGFKYPQFKVELIGTEIVDEKMNKVAKAGKKVLADKAKKEVNEDEEININDIPF